MHPFGRPVLPGVKNTCDSDSGSVSSILSSDIMFASSASNNLDASRTRRSWIPSFRIRDAWQSLVTAAGSRCESTMTVAQDMSSSTEASREGGSEVQSGDMAQPATAIASSATASSSPSSTMTPMTCERFEARCSGESNGGSLPDRSTALCLVRRYDAAAIVRAHSSEKLHSTLPDGMLVSQPMQMRARRRPRSG